MRFWIKDKLKRLCCQYKLEEVFTPNTTAKVTYVSRALIENDLKKDLLQMGRAIIVYGHSGSGKTTLIRRIFKEMKINYIQIQCEHDTTFMDILVRAIDRLGVFYVSHKKTNRRYHLTEEGKTTFNILSASLHVGVERMDEATSTRLLAPQITTQQLAKLLGEIDAVLVLEDFHKVQDSEKTRIADCLKIFIDSANEFPKLKFICLGAVDTPRELINQSADLYPRVSEMYVPMLSDEELTQMIEKGCRALNIEMSQTLQDKIVHYSNNLASLTHKMCYDICYSNGIKKRGFLKKKIDDAKFKQATDAFIRANSDSLKRVYDSSTKDKIGWYILKTVSTYGNPISFFDIYEKISRSKVKYDQEIVKKKLDELISGDVNILRYDKNSQKYSISTPFWGAFLKIKLATEKAQKEKSMRKKYNKNLGLANIQDIDSIVELSFLNLIENYKEK